MSKWQKITAIISVFYLVGALATFTSYRFQIFETTPIILIMTYGVYLWLIKGKMNLQYSLVAGGYGFIVEVLGVSTGFPFGEYSYGEGLGAKLLDVPLVLVINWSLLSIISFYSLISMGNKFVRIFLAALLMVGLDLLIEPVAIYFDWWCWDDASVPLSNYLGWFIASLIIMCLYEWSLNRRVFKGRTESISRMFFLMQVLFFLVVNWSIW